MSVIGSTVISFSEEQSMLMDVAREFCRDKSPISAVREFLDSESGYDPSVWREMVDLGWTGIALAEAYGGSGLGPAAVVPVVEAMGRSMLGTPLISTTLASQLIQRAGNSEQCERLLPEIVGGAIATCALLENPDWGDNSIGCTLGADGVLQGRKVMVTDAGVADWLLVPCTRDGETLIALVSKDQLESAAMSMHTLIDETRRSASVDFSGVVVASENIISGDGVETGLRDVHLLGALLLAAETAGSAGACLDTIVEYLNTRKQFGNLIGSYQSLKHTAVEILTSLDAGRSFVYHGASLVDDEPVSKDAEIAARMAKAQATDTLAFAGDRAVQFHGGMGFTYECDAQLFIRRAQWSQQQFGDAMHHRKRLAALLLD